MAKEHILLGVTGGIAAYKAAELTRLLRKQDYEVQVVMTEQATKLVTPATFQALSGRPVLWDQWQSGEEHGMSHIELAKWADKIIVAPATANFIARLAHGLADDLLSTICCATRADILVAPAMNETMWQNSATQNNIAIVEARDVQLIGPASGEQACGDTGLGRMEEPENILQALMSAQQAAVLEGSRVVITAGPTREAIDPVRYLSNNSSGKMGFALAHAAMEMGAEVTLVAGPVQLPCASGIRRIDVTTAGEMYDAVMSVVQTADMFIGAAAVSDYRPVEVATQKIKKEQESLELSLVKTPDILAAVAALPRRPVVVGFAAETDHLAEHARAKLQAKKLDLLIANDVSREDIGFTSDANEVTVFHSNGELPIEKMPKRLLAKKLMTLIYQYSQKEKLHA